MNCIHTKQHKHGSNLRPEGYMAASSLGSANDQSASPAHYIRFHYLMVEVGVGVGVGLDDSGIRFV